MRMIFLVVVLLVWAVVVLVRLWKTGEAPDPITWGIPPGLWALLHPRQRAEPQGSAVAEPAEQEGAS